MSKSRNLQKVGKREGLSVEKNLLKESRTELGNTEGSDLSAAYILGRNAKGGGRAEELVNALIVHLNVENTRVSILFKHLILGRHIVTELVKLKDGIVKI